MVSQAGAARKTAYTILLRVFRSGAYANLAFDAESRCAALDKRDSHFAFALVQIVLERRITLDYQLLDLCSTPPDKLTIETLVSIYIGLAQLYFMDKVPVHAIINESVELVKGGKAAKTAGLVNAVLRRAAQRSLKYPDPSERVLFLSVRYAVPEWLVRLWQTSYGDSCCEAMLAAAFEHAKTTVRVNTLRTNIETLTALWVQAGLQAIPPPLSVPNAVCLPQGAGDVSQLPGFAEGLFHVQDAAAQLCCLALDPQPGETIFDLCSAPGGKAFTIAQLMQDSGKIVALDLHEKRVGLIQQGASRLGLESIFPYTGNATDSERILTEFGKADRVLCDVPCSGLGILQKKPDIRENLQPELDKLPKIQYLIIEAGSKCLRAGGTLLYSSCTLNPNENERVCERFLMEHPAFLPEPIFPDIPGLHGQGDAFLTLLPQNGTDGFFLAKFRLRGNQ